MDIEGSRNWDCSDSHLGQKSHSLQHRLRHSVPIFFFLQFICTKGQKEEQGKRSNWNKQLPVVYNLKALWTHRYRGSPKLMKCIAGNTEELGKRWQHHNLQCWRCKITYQGCSCWEFAAWRDLWHEIRSRLARVVSFMTRLKYSEVREANTKYINMTLEKLMCFWGRWLGSSW